LEFEASFALELGASASSVPAEVASEAFDKPVTARLRHRVDFPALRNFLQRLQLRAPDVHVHSQSVAVQHVFAAEYGFEAALGFAVAGFVCRLLVGAPMFVAKCR
jgi:hypothetical protein